MRGVGSKGHDTEQPPLRTPADLGPLVVDVEMRILVLRDAERSQHARQRSDREMSAPLRAPRAWWRPTSAGPTVARRGPAR